MHELDKHGSFYRRGSVKPRPRHEARVTRSGRVAKSPAPRSTSAAYFEDEKAGRSVRESKAGVFCDGEYEAVIADRKVIKCTCAHPVLSLFVAIRTGETTSAAIIDNIHGTDMSTLDSLLVATGNDAIKDDGDAERVRVASAILDIVGKKIRVRLCRGKAPVYVPLNEN